MCVRAMLHPRWIPFLGRKNCPPAVPLTPRVVEYPDLETAVRKYPVDRKDAGALDVLQAEIECGEGEAPSWSERIRADEVIDGSRDLYRARRVRLIGIRTGEVCPCS